MTRADLHDLIDELPESAFPEAERYLVALRDGLAPVDEDDEPLSPEEEAMIAASRAAHARGAIVSQGELRARLAARRGDN
jgi:hypothetical protein